MSEAVKEVPKKERPQFRNIHVAELSNYRMAVGSIVSILHRVSGFIMFALLPCILYMLELSLRSEMSYAYFQGIAAHWFVKLITLGLVWAFLHHFCAGIRHLFMDVHVAIEKEPARKTASTVLVVSLVLTALVALKLFGVF
ncbi:succinate dehydrogenase, cytochrome b556 subunit [Janthinobacterium sp. PC23-8]|uniref:succinate dehydrogenase, cytochrome b556 subunit n=1 Tax=Janthinobacterium sp. PC23-8 TaxID=2012679 RepID=UPI000B97A8F7|nr:succinate dehydrogenase, cytochrome b556 subunit [Janthinobacterium sp. PC23-8]OYO30174.1 succinate dehydrogenase, cytochrome b556 subunit [Janthinobacterium sp. PC23-8]